MNRFHIQIRNLSKLLFIKVINLGETATRAMNIKSLNWILESESPIEAGFSMDDQMEGACKALRIRISVDTRTVQLHR